LTGLLTFMIIEKIFPENDDDEDSEDVNSAVSICVNLYGFCIKQLLTVVHILSTVMVSIVFCQV